jgi:hypothetical protein
MKTQLSAEATEYGTAARRAFHAAGGDSLAQSAEAAPTTRDALLSPVLADVAAFDLRPLDDEDDLEAAAALCRAAGYWLVPDLVAERLARSTGADGTFVVDARFPRAAALGLKGTWSAVGVDGRRYSAGFGAMAAAPHVSPFVTDVDLEPQDGTDEIRLALLITLQCWTLLGMLDRALELTIDYVKVRHQFGQPLSRFQNVRFQLADAEVERGGLDVLAHYSLWSVQTRQPEMVDDAIALRMTALEAADAVLRKGHQLHGAFGFCDEAKLSWISRHSASLRQLPTGLSGTRQLLLSRVDRKGLAGIFSS